MSLVSLLIIASAATGSVLWLLHYVPLSATRPKTIWLSRDPTTNKTTWWPKTINVLWSPKLFVCKLLVPFDIGITLFLIFAGMLGLTTMVTGISMMIFNVLVAAGWSTGVGIVHKWLKPRYEKQYQIEQTQQKEVI